jgi:hypothetical protein
MTRNDRLHEYVTAIGADQTATHEDGYVHFRLHDCDGRVRVKAGGNRIRASVVVDIVDDIDTALGWVDSQPLPASSELALWHLDDGNGVLRLVWERTLARTLGHGDPIADELEAFVRAWREHATADVSDEPFRQPDPRDPEPEQAWLIIADDGAWPSDDELGQYQESGNAGIFECLWTGAKQTQAGDLVLIYFMGERKAAHFVARAASAAFYTSDIDVNAVSEAGNEQWWVYLTPLVEIEPIRFADLKEACNGHLILKGRSGKFLHPDTIDRLTFTAINPEQQAEVNRVVQRPAGRADLPDADSMTWEQVGDLAGGALGLESDVSRYVLNPLLRHCLEGSGLTFVAEYPIGKKRADFVVVDHEEPTCVVEVKLAINDGGDWSRSPDLQQTIGYAHALGCPAVLIDANRIILIDANSTEPRQIIERRSLDRGLLHSGNIDDLAEHLGVPYGHGGNGYNSWRWPAHLPTQNPRRFGRLRPDGTTPALRGPGLTATGKRRTLRPSMRGLADANEPSGAWSKPDADNFGGSIVHQAASNDATREKMRQVETELEEAQSTVDEQLAPTDEPEQES